MGCGASQQVSPNPESAPLVDKNPWRPPISDHEREQIMAAAPRYDMMSAWRGEGGTNMDDGRDVVGRDVLHLGRGVDWYADNQPFKAESIYDQRKAKADIAGAGRTLAKQHSRSTPSLTPK